MPRSAAHIQTEITAIETKLADSASLNSSMSSDGVSVSFAQRRDLEKRLDLLYAQLDRANGDSPMFRRGIVKGLQL